MKKVTDTSRLDPAILLLEMMASGGSSQAIVAQEARGQQEVVNSDQLPTKGLLGAERHLYEAMGIKILTPGPGAEHTLPDAKTDTLFTMVELPKGWKKVATNHSMWNNLVDEKGRIRATFFYKAAFYDREAFIRPCRRFSIEQNYERPDYKDVFEFQVKDGKKVVFSIEKPMPAKKEDGREDYKARELLEAEMQRVCARWLIDNGFPNFNDFDAHWD